MGRAQCTVEGFIANVRTGTTKSGKPFVQISMCCGKSTKDEATGQYDNANQQWWTLSAYGEYADRLAKEQLQKGDAIVARVADPLARVFHNDKTQKYEATIEGTLWNFSVSRAVWYKRNGAIGGSPTMPGLNDNDLASMESSGYGAGEIEIPF